MITWDGISQIIIFFFGISAIILIDRKNKWGFVIGLASQPFWLITSYINHQSGVFLLSIVYTFAWMYGIYRWFYKKSGTDKS